VKRAIISDIHGNLEALTAVLARIKELQISQIICLGDIIGYGPNPIECLDLVISQCQWTILGNHDQAALFDPEGFNPVASRAIYWTRKQLEADQSAKADQRWDFLGELPRRHDEGKYLFVHGSPRDPTNEYVFPEMIYDRDLMGSLFSRIEGCCFQGHTHLPGCFTENREFYTPDQSDFVFNLSDTKCMFNVGSVGQPRDGDPRACFVVLDSDQGRVEYHRVEYDVETTSKKIYAIRDLDDVLGDRLLGGR
jgi:predicted phosphodiesterase